MSHFPRRYACRRCPEPPLLEGLPEGPVWALADWSEDFVDISTSVVPWHRTRMKMLWDDECLYVGAELEEPHIWATLTEHDSVIFQDNDFEVFLWPDEDRPDYFEFEINALNTTWDLYLPKPYRDGGGAVNEWEIPGMRHAVHIDGTLNDPSDVDRRWCVTLAFPWRAFVPPTPCPLPAHTASRRGGSCPLVGDVWRINFSRVQWETTIEDGRYVKVPGKPEDNWVWSPQGVIDMHQPEQWGFVEFVR